jgi:protein O-mannosyl-transferase
VTLQAQKGAIAALELLTLPMRLTNAVISYGLYIWQMFWPARLAVLYVHPGKAEYALALLVLLLLAVVTFAAVYLGRRRRYLIVGWLIYLVTLVPVIGLIQVGGQAHADRYTYVPLVGLFIMIAWGAADVVAFRPRLKAAFIAASVVLLAAAAIVTHRTVGYWHDDVALFGRAVEVGQRSRWTLGNLGAALGNRGRIDEGLAYLQEALTMGPDDARTLMSIGSLMLNSGRLKEAEEYNARALRVDPSMKEANAAMAMTLVKLGRPQDAIPYCQKAIDRDPAWAHGYNVMGMVLADMGRLNESLEAFSRAISLNPSVAQFYNNMATAYIRKGQLPKAVDTYNRCLAIEPSALTWGLKGRIQLEMGLLDDAEASARQAIRLSPDSPDVHLNRAFVLEKLGRANEAVSELRTVLSLDPRNAQAQASLSRLAPDR